MITLPHERAHTQTHIQGSKIHDGWLPSTYIIHLDGVTQNDDYGGFTEMVADGHPTL
jgi:hypothetical protein